MHKCDGREVGRSVGGLVRLLAYIWIIGRGCPVHVPSSRRRNAAAGPASSAVRTCPGGDPCGRCAPSSWPDADVQVTTWPVKAAVVLAGGRKTRRQATCRTDLSLTSPVYLQYTVTSHSYSRINALIIVNSSEYYMYISEATWVSLERCTHTQSRIIHCAGCTMGGGPRRKGPPPISCQIFTTLRCFDV